MNRNTTIVLCAAGILAVGQLLASDAQPTPVAPIAPIKAPFDMPQLQRPVFPNRSFKLTDYGAMADGTSKNTEAFRNFHFKNITAHDMKRGALSVTGLPERRVAGLVMENLTIDGAAGGQFTDVEDLKCANARITPARGPVLALSNAAGVLFERTPSPKGAGVFLEVKGDRTRNIRLQDCDYSGAKEGIAFGKEVPAETKAAKTN